MPRKEAVTKSRLFCLKILIEILLYTKMEEFH